MGSLELLRLLLVGELVDQPLQRTEHLLIPEQTFLVIAHNVHMPPQHVDALVKLGSLADWRFAYCCRRYRRGRCGCLVRGSCLRDTAEPRFEVLNALL